MANCKDCIHQELCKDYVSSLTEVQNADPIFIAKWLDEIEGKSEQADDDCEHFKDRSRFVELPVRLGDTVYRLIHGTIDEYKVVSINYYVCSTFTDYTITSKHLSAPVNFNFDVNAIGKIVFLSREEAEQALNGACRKCMK